MPTYRRLQTKLLESHELAMMPNDLYRLTWVLLPLILSREGTTIYDAHYLACKLFPLRTDITDDEIALIFYWFEDRGLIRPYTVEGRRYLYMPGFHQNHGDCEKEAASPYPPVPPELRQGEEDATPATAVSKEGNATPATAVGREGNATPATAVGKEGASAQGIAVQRQENPTPVHEEGGPAAALPVHGEAPPQPFSAPTPEALQSSSGATPELLQRNSGVTPEALQSSSSLDVDVDRDVDGKAGVDGDGAAPARSSLVGHSSLDPPEETLLLRLYQAFQRGTGQKPTNVLPTGLARDALCQLAGERYTPEDVEGCARYLKRGWWRDKPLTIPKVADTIGQWVAYGRPAAPRRGRWVGEMVVEVSAWEVAEMRSELQRMSAAAGTSEPNGCEPSG